MSDYAQLLLRREWLDFRDEFIASRTLPHRCDSCGENTHAPLQVHHKRYHRDKMPWEYEFADLRLICSKCHEAIHMAETRARNIVRTLPPWAIPELNQFLAELEKLDDHGKQIVFAKAKNVARGIPARNR